eukprot:s7715_g1.t1
MRAFQITILGGSSMEACAQEMMGDDTFLLGDGCVHQEGVVELQRQDLVFMGNKCANDVGQESVVSDRPGGRCMVFALAGFAFALVGARLSSVRLLGQAGLR